MTKSSPILLKKQKPLESQELPTYHLENLKSTDEILVKFIENYKEEFSAESWEFEANSTYKIFFWLALKLQKLGICFFIQKSEASR